MLLLPNFTTLGQQLEDGFHFATRSFPIPDKSKRKGRLRHCIATTSEHMYVHSYLNWKIFNYVSQSSSFSISRWISSYSRLVAASVALFSWITASRFHRREVAKVAKVYADHRLLSSKSWLNYIATSGQWFQPDCIHVAVDRFHWRHRELEIINYNRRYWRKRQNHLQLKLKLEMILR